MYCSELFLSRPLASFLELIRPNTIFWPQFLEVIKLEGIGHTPEDAMMPREMFLLQVSNT